MSVFGEDSARSDLLYLVDRQNKVIGEATKEECHTVKGRMHRAVAVWFVDTRINVLMTKRSDKKPLWPGFWTEAYATHPRVEEKAIDAAIRRSEEELGFPVTCVSEKTPLVYEVPYCIGGEVIGYEQEYLQQFTRWIEPHEKELIVPNKDEIIDYDWMPLSKLEKEIHDPVKYAPWTILGFDRLRQKMHV